MRNHNPWVIEKVELSDGNGPSHTVYWMGGDDWSDSIDIGVFTEQSSRAAKAMWRTTGKPFTKALTARQLTDAENATLKAKFAEDEAARFAKANEYDPAMDARVPDEPSTEQLDTTDAEWEDPAEQTTELVPADDAVDIDGADLGELADIANKYHAQCERVLTDALRLAKVAGDALLAAKGQLPHGEFKTWVEANFMASYRTARAYMQVASNWQRAATLDTGGSIRGAIKSAAKPRAKSRPKPKPETEVPTVHAGEWSFTCTSNGQTFVNVGGDYVELVDLDDDTRAEVREWLNRVLGLLGDIDEEA